MAQHHPTLERSFLGQRPASRPVFSINSARRLSTEAEASARAAVGLACIAVHRLHADKEVDEGAALVLSDLAVALTLEAERLAVLGDKLRRMVQAW